MTAIRFVNSQPHLQESRDASGARRGARGGRRLRRRLRRAAARRAGRDDRQPRELHALHADAARGRLGDARAAAHRRAAPPDVPACRARARPRDRDRRGPADGARRDDGRRARSTSATTTSCSHSVRCHAPSRCPASPSTASASRISPTRSTCATASCASSRPPTRRSTRATPRATSASSSSARATPASRRSPSSPISCNDALRWYPRLRERAAALGARRRGAEDPARDPAPPGRVRGQGAHRPRGRNPRLDHAGVVRRRARPSSRTASGSRRTRSSGRRA